MPAVTLPVTWGATGVVAEPTVVAADAVVVVSSTSVEVFLRTLVVFLMVDVLLVDVVVVVVLSVLVVVVIVLVVDVGTHSSSAQSCPLGHPHSLHRGVSFPFWQYNGFSVRCIKD